MLKPETQAELQRLRQQEINHLEGKKDHINAIYRSLPDTLARASKLTGIEPDQLIDICVIASRNYKDIEWYQLLELVAAFHVTHERLKADAATE